MSYEVSFETKTIKITTYNKKVDKIEILFVEGVLTHSFETILTNNILLSIEECSIELFIKENINELELNKNYCWPIDYNNIDELESFLVDNKYKYIKIYSSYGLSG